MNLLLDVTERGVITLALFDEKKTLWHSEEGRNTDTLSAVNTFLKDNDLSPEKLDGVATVVGAGGFTSTRVATTIANIFAFVQDVPVCGIVFEKSRDLPFILDKLKQAPKPKYIVAEYSGEPSIGGTGSKT